MANLRTRTEVTGMVADNSKRPDVVFTTDDGTEILTDVITCCPVKMSASSNDCAKSAAIVGYAAAEGHKLKDRLWAPSLHGLPYQFQALAHEIGRISEASLDFLETRIIQRLPANDRQRFRTYAHQHLAATTALGTARVIRSYLPIRRDTTGRVLPRTGDAIPPLGSVPLPPPGQFRRGAPRQPTCTAAHTTTTTTPTTLNSPRETSPPQQAAVVRGGVG